MEQLHAWQTSGLDVRMAVNLSARLLSDHKLPDRLASQLVNAGVTPDKLTLEITETMLLRDRARALKTLTQLHALGVGLSIDDFGTGYSSLGYLPRLPVDTLKIDRSFVAELGVNHTALSLIEGMISLAHSIGKHVVVEGVETNEQLEVLKRIGCDEIQGFLLGRPTELPAWDEPPDEFRTSESAATVQILA
jgi:EAL domain-containing protein (putative c-di-GMP-specific phosphodiesterase class I)